MDNLKGVVLVNMGGPESPQELRKFLSRMFMDPYILPYNKLVRFALSQIISSLRYKKSWKKYEQIGGTPIVRSMISTAQALQNRLGSTFVVKYAFSYSEPGIGIIFDQLKADRIRDIVVLPLYPQESHTTTWSVKTEIQHICARDSFFQVRFIEEFYTDQEFLNFWISNIAKHLDEHQIESPTLVFSAHSIPQYHVDKGDTYPTAIINSAAMIADSMNLHYEAAFQSGMRRGTWIGPDVREHLALLASEGVEEIVLIPISFVHENLETKYDLDMELIPFAKETLGIHRISRVQLPEADPLLIGMLAKLVKMI